MRKVLLVTLFAFLSACHHHAHNVVYQPSNIAALMEGVYDGDVTFRQLRCHGDFGIGTFNDLDGEMIAVDGVYYQIKTDGKAYPVDGGMKTPFASVTFFKADSTVKMAAVPNMKELESLLDKGLPTKNIIYAIRIDGKFKYVKTRSVPKQAKPYPRLPDAAKLQSEFELRDVEGTLVGFRFPDYVKGVNVPGYHFHFITADRAMGGHVLEVAPNDVEAKIDNITGLYMALPHEGSFYDAQLTGDKQIELNKVEKDRK